MKIFALTILLISICYVQGGLVKRQAEEETQAEVPNVLTAQFTEFIRRLQQETEEFASSFQEKFRQATPEAIRTQFETAFQQFQDSLIPVTEQVRQNLGRFFPRPTQQATEDGA